MIKLDEIKVYLNLFKEDENNRIINIHELNNVIAQETCLYYPNILFYNSFLKEIYNPINEQVMSLKKANIKNNLSFAHGDSSYIKTEESPLFFFVYNTENYYHFVYDTLPYLISFNLLKKKIPNIKLLMNFPNKNKTQLYSFVSEFLDILNINLNEIIFIEKNVLYKKIYISSSYTHGIDSNLPPRKEIYDFYKSIKNKVINHKNDYPKKIYISRRSWIHNDLSNIGTNYTDRRKMQNEDQLVDFLKERGYVEIFTELLDIKEKINIFANAESIIGAIGGGLCNVLFSDKKCNLISIISPGFLDINNRFLYCFKNINLK